MTPPKHASAARKPVIEIPSNFHLQPVGTRFVCRFSWHAGALGEICCSADFEIRNSGAGCRNMAMQVVGLRGVWLSWGTSKAHEQ